MNIFDKIERTISQRHEQAFDNLGKGIEAMATSFENFDLQTLGSRITKKMMVHLDAIGDYLMEGGNQEDILDKLGKKIEEKQELAFDPVLEYFNKPAYELDQNLFGKVVKFEEDKSHERGNVEIARKTSMRSRNSSAGSYNSKRKSRPPSSQRSIKLRKSIDRSIKRSRSPSQGSCSSLKKPQQLSPKSSRRSSSSRSIKKARPGSSEGKRSLSVESDYKSEKSVEEKQEICRQEINEAEPLPCSDDNNEVRQINSQEAPQMEVQLVPNPHVKQVEEEQPVTKDNAEILIQRTERLETRFHRAEKLKAEITKLHPLTQKAEEKPQEEGEANNEAGHQTVKIESQQSAQANPDKKEEVFPSDYAETAKKPSSPSKLQGSVERPSSIKKQKTPPKMPYNIDVQCSKSIEKTKSLTPKKL